MFNKLVSIIFDGDKRRKILEKALIELKISELFRDVTVMKYEEKLLIECCKGNMVNNINYLQIDWNNLLMQATIHGVAGVLHRQFAEDTNAPRWFREVLKQTYYFRRDTGNRKLHVFNSVLATLDKKGIVAIVLKGVYLAPFLYKDCGIREFSDLDILVKKSDLQKVYMVLKEFGFIQGEYNSREDKIVPCPDKTLKERAEELQHDSPFIKVDRVADIPLIFQIEVHTRLETVFDNTLMETQKLFFNKVRYKIPGGYTNRLANKDMLIHLCYHNYWHTQSLQDIYKLRDIMLRQYMDIRLFIKSVEINWREIEEKKQDSRLWIPICYSLYFCHKIFEDVLPEEMLKVIDIQFVEWEEKNIYDRWITKYQGMKALGRYTCDFSDRIFSIDRYKLAISNCELKEYIDNPDVKTYFKFLMNDNKLFLLDDIDLK